MTDDESFQRLDQWLTVIENDIVQLRASQYIFWEVQKIVSGNPKVNVENAFHEWMGAVYANSMSVGIRRLVDGDRKNKSISFVRLLKEIQRHPSILSRVRYRSVFGARGKLPVSSADNDFDRHVGLGEDHVSQEAITKEIKDLRDATVGLNRYVDKRVAHYDRREFKEILTFGDIDDALDHLEAMLRRYILLFRAADLISATPCFQYDWKVIFRVPWISERPAGE